MAVSSRVNFVNLTDVGDPVDSARAYYEATDELVFLTSQRLRQSLKQRLIWCVVVADQVFIPFTVGGGPFRLKTRTRCSKLVLTRLPSIPQPLPIRN